MIRFQRSMRVRRGRHATQWAKELADYMNAAHGKPKLQLFTSRFGTVSALYWMADFADLSALETWQRKVGADAAYRELVKKSFDIVIDGTVEDTVLQFV
jgi:hypothetical protein